MLEAPASAAAEGAGPEARAGAWVRAFSIEVTPRGRARLDEVTRALPPGRRVFIAAPPGWSPAATLRTARRLAAAGMRPVPHLAARRIAHPTQLRRLVRALGAAGVEEVLAIAGDRDLPAGPYDSSLQLLQAVDWHAEGITRIWVGGHPERHPKVAKPGLWQALRDKDRWARDTGIELGIVTQFTFDGAPVARYLSGLAEAGFDRPVRIGVHGVIKPRTLLHFGRQLGLRHTARTALRHLSMVLRLLGVTTPEKIVARIAADTPDAAAAHVAGVHFYPFGAVERTAQWALDRETAD